MRSLVAVLFLALVTTVRSQTVTTVQNGLWDSPATWDCGCVPDNSPSLVIMHSVEIIGAIELAQPMVTVDPLGEVTMAYPGTVIINTNFINQGHVLLSGEIHIPGFFNSMGFTEFIGQVDIAAPSGSLIIPEGGFVQIEGDLTNNELLQGDGAICVLDTTENNGSISGDLDFCDLSPTVTVPPFLDSSPGPVDNSVTFCQNNPCATSVTEVFASGLQLLPSITAEQATLIGIPTGSTVQLIDAAGRIAWPGTGTRAERLELPLGGLPNGAYRVVVRGAAGQRVLPLVIAR